MVSKKHSNISLMLILAKKKVWFYSLQRIKKAGTKIDNEVEIQVFFSFYYILHETPFLNFLPAKFFHFHLWSI